MIEVNYSWETRRYPRPNRWLFERFAVRAAHFARLPETPDWGFNLRFVGDRAMTAANHDFVGHIGTTDVITFSYFDAPETLFPGEPAVELIICCDAARREGQKRAGESDYSREMALYVVHGLLHSAGEDDLAPETRRSMRRREREVMGQLVKEFDFAGIFPPPEC
ncbi:MAG: rRNA maturation RNase YbeY [Victivallaceae bacterium]|nr:rRNA maturation RNase YbeY [Victivallaceae bacterium]